MACYTLSTRDAIGISDFETLKIEAKTDAEFLLMEIPMQVLY